jgi:hypothetical protein
MAEFPLRQSIARNSCAADVFGCNFALDWVLERAQREAETLRQQRNA